MFENRMPHSTHTSVPRLRECLVSIVLASSDATVQLICITDESSSFGKVIEERFEVDELNVLEVPLEDVVEAGDDDDDDGGGF